MQSALAGHIRGQFPAQVTGGADETGKIRTWLAANEEFLHQVEHRYQVDADLVALQVSNRKPELFPVLMDRLRKDANDEVAKRVAKRYLPDVEPEATAIQAFVEAHKDRLFFSDVGGYRWILAPAGLPAQAK